MRSPLAVARAVLLSLHTLKMWQWFRDVDFSAPAPLINVDYIQYWGRALRAHHFLSESGRFWGYDPFDMAGYVSGPFLEVGVHFISLVAHVLSPIVPIHRTMLFLEVAGLALAPLLVLPTVQNLGGTRAQAWSAFGLTLLLFGFLEPFSERMLGIGLFGFMVSSFVALYQVSLMWRWVNAGSFRLGLGLCAVTAVLFQLHPASLLVVAVPNVALLIVFARRLTAARWAMGVLFIGLVVAANWYWIRPFVSFSEWKTDAAYFSTDGLAGLVRVFNPFKTSVFGVVQPIVLIFLAVGAGAALRRLQARERELAGVLALWLGALFACAYFGSDWPVIARLQPGRNQFPFWMLAGVTASFAVPEPLLATRRRCAMGWTVWAAVFVLMFLPLRRAGWRIGPLTNRLPDEQRRTLDFLMRHPVDGRILMESVDWHRPHFADMLPFIVPGQAFLGGHHPGNFLLGRFTLFTGAYYHPDGWGHINPVAFDKPLRTMSEETFRNYLQLYNVRTVGARMPQTVSALAAFPGLFTSSVTAGAYVFFSVRAPSTWFEVGSGRVSLALDRIQINDASRGRLVLKCHWIKTLAVEPPVPITPVFLADDPVPFIALDNHAGHQELVVYNAGL